MLKNIVQRVSQNADVTIQDLKNYYKKSHEPTYINFVTSTNSISIPAVRDSKKVSVKILRIISPTDQGVVVLKVNQSPLITGINNHDSFTLVTGQNLIDNEFSLNDTVWQQDPTKITISWTTKKTTGEDITGLTYVGVVKESGV